MRRRSERPAPASSSREVIQFVVGRLNKPLAAALGISETPITRPGGQVVHTRRAEVLGVPIRRAAPLEPPPPRS
jgi:hypothetical protein